MRRFGSAFVFLGVVSLAAAGQDAVTIKITYPKPGERARTRVEEKTTNKTIFTIGGMDQGKDEVKTKSLIYVDEIIENPKNAKRATKLKRTFEKAVIGLDGRTTTLPIEGKTVLIEKKGDTYSFTVDGKALEGESLALLSSEFNKPDEGMREIALPKEPIKPGGKWNIDKNALAKSLAAMGGPAFDKDKMTATGTLVKTYMKDGKQFGVLQIAIEGPITSLGGKNELEIKDGKLTLLYSGDGCIDGTSADGKSTGKMTLAVTGSTANVVIKAQIESTESRAMEMLPKK